MVGVGEMYDGHDASDTPSCVGISIKADAYKWLGLARCTMAMEKRTNRHVHVRIDSRRAEGRANPQGRVSKGEHGMIVV